MCYTQKTAERRGTCHSSDRGSILLNRLQDACGADYSWVQEIFLCIYDVEVEWRGCVDHSLKWWIRLDGFIKSAGLSNVLDNDKIKFVFWGVWMILQDFLALLMRSYAGDYPVTMLEKGIEDVGGNKATGAQRSVQRALVKWGSERTFRRRGKCESYFVKPSTRASGLNVWKVRSTLSIGRLIFKDFLFQLHQSDPTRLTSSFPLFPSVNPLGRSSGGYRPWYLQAHSRAGVEKCSDKVET